MNSSAVRSSDPAAFAGGDAALDVLASEAESALERGDHGLATERAEAALAGARQSGDRAVLLRASRLLVMLHRREGHGERAVAAGQAALPLLREGADPAGLSDLLCLMTLAFIDLGLNDEALRHVSESVDAARAAGDRSQLCWAYNRVGLTQRALGRHAEAEQLLLDALAIARELHSDEQVFSALNNLGITASDAHDFRRERGDAEAARAAIARARRYGEEAVSLAARSGNAYREAVALSNLSRYMGIAGHAAAGMKLLERARALSVAHDYQPMVMLCDSVRCEMLVNAGQHDEAIALGEPLLAMPPELYDHDMVLDIHRQLYLACKASGRPAQALDHHEQYHALVRRQLEHRADAQSRVLLNRLELDQAKFETERALMQVELQRMQTEKMAIETLRLEEQARQLGRYVLEDPLTGLGNRRLLDRELPRLVAQSDRGGQQLALAMVDIDHFKLVNDRFGHPVGDAVLKALADIFRGRLRAGDLAVRMGGEEFVLVLAGTPLEAARDACDRLRQAVQAHDWNALAPGVAVTISIGLAGHASQEPAAWIADADRALYRAKRRGRNRVVVYDPADGAGD